MCGLYQCAVCISARFVSVRGSYQCAVRIRARFVSGHGSYQGMASAVPLRAFQDRGFSP